MNLLRDARSDLNAQNEHLARIFYANGRYNTPFLIVTGIGFIAIYFLTYLGIFGQTAPQLIYVGLLTITLAAMEQPLLSLARRGRGIAVNMFATATVGAFAVALTFLWEGILPVTILVTLITPLTVAIRVGMDTITIKEVSKRD
jgi:hypothetical protein